MIRPVTDKKKEVKPKKKGRRLFAVLFFFVAFAYLLLFLGIYIFAGGIDLNRFLFGQKEGITLSSSIEDGNASNASTRAESDEKTILPPLDDVPGEAFTPALAEPLKSQVPPASTQPRAQVEMAPPPQVPGVSLIAKLSPIKCWDDRGFEHSADECDGLAGLSHVAEMNLDMVEQCRQDLSTSVNTGLLAMFAEVDFVRGSFTVWPGFQSTLKSADKIADCITDRFRTLSFLNVPHRFTRYRIKGDIRFEGPRRTSEPVQSITPTRTVELRKAAENAQEVTVSKERVRVRKTPVSGEIIGFISTGQKVKLLEITDEWCLVKTKRGNVGWMICWGLDIPGQTGPTPPPAASAAPAAPPSKPSPKQ